MLGLLLMPPEGVESFLTPDEEEEKQRLLVEGFLWTRNDLQAFIRAPRHCLLADHRRDASMDRAIRDHVHSECDA